MEWSIAITRAAQGPDLETLGKKADSLVHALNDEILDLAPGVGSRPDHYTVRIAVEAATALEAAAYALTQVLGLSTRPMPNWPVVDVQVTEWDEFMRQLEPRPRLAHSA